MKRLLFFIILVSMIFAETGTKATDKNTAEAYAECAVGDCKEIDGVELMVMKKSEGAVAEAYVDCMIWQCEKLGGEPIKIQNTTHYKFGCDFNGSILKEAAYYDTKGARSPRGECLIEGLAGNAVNTDVCCFPAFLLAGLVFLSLKDRA